MNNDNDNINNGIVQDMVVRAPDPPGVGPFPAAAQQERGQDADADNNNGNNNNPPAAPPRAVIPEEHRIESLDQWLQMNGLPAPSNRNDDMINNDRWERVQDRQRVAQAQAYERSIHEKAFATFQQEEAQTKAQKERELKSWQGTLLTITCQEGQQLENLDLVTLAASCDAIFAMAHYNPNNCKEDEDDVDMEQSNVNTASVPKRLHFNLPDYSVTVVQTLVDLVYEKMTLEDIDDDHMIVELCQLAHYLQHTTLLQETVQILLQSIDTTNCLALTQLADQLHLPRLFEAALQHMMQSVHNLEEGECWDHLTPELQQRITAIRSAIQSSIHDQRSALYFGSIQEYLAIFAERVYYYKERLAQALEQQAELPQTPAWFDAQRKIERQRARLHTLQVAFQEQKKMFGASSWR